MCWHQKVNTRHYEPKGTKLPFTTELQDVGLAHQVRRGRLGLQDDITNDKPELLPQFEEKIGCMYSTFLDTK